MYMSVFLLTVIFYDFTPLNLQLNNNKQKRQKLEPGLLISLSDSCRIVDPQDENADPDPTSLEINRFRYPVPVPFINPDPKESGHEVIRLSFNVNITCFRQFFLI